MVDDDRVDLDRATRERAILAAYLGVMLVFTPLVAEMVARAWESQGVVYVLMTVPYALAGVTFAQLGAFGFGIYAGFLGLLWFDSLKRWQAGLLTLATAIGFVVLRSRGLFRVNLAGNLPLFVGGLLVALFVGNARKLKTDPPYEFRQAASGLFVLLSAVVVLSLLEAGVAYRNPLVPTDGGVAVASGALDPRLLVGDLLANGAVVGLYLAVTWRFLQYEVGEDLVVVGPARTGKTTFVTGAAKAAEAAGAGTSPEKTPKLVEHSQNLWNDIDPTNPQEYHRLGFRYLTGAHLKEYVRLDALDYAGGYIDRSLLDELARQLSTWRAYRWQLLQFFGQAELPERDTVGSRDEMYRTLAQQLVRADTLVFLFDVASFIDPDLERTTDKADRPPLLADDGHGYLQVYEGILNEVSASDLTNKNVVFVATKADYLLDDFADSDLGEGFDAAAYESFDRERFLKTLEFDAFEAYVNRRLTDRAAPWSDKIGDLLAAAELDADDDPFHPVFFAIDRERSRREGEPVLVRPLTMGGFENVLEVIES